jgi:hypothetical protein
VIRFHTKAVRQPFGYEKRTSLEIESDAPITHHWKMRSISYFRATGRSYST